MKNKTISTLVKSFFVGLFIFFVLNSFNLVSASCKMPGTPLEEFGISDAVFIGKVKSIEKFDDGVNKVNFLVIDAYKGVSENIVIINAADPSFVSVGIGFDEGETYLVYAYEGEGGVLTTNICSRTAPLKDAQKDIGDFAILSSRSGPNAETLIISNDQKEGDFFTIKNIEVINQDLVIEVSYGGGCEDHEFDLIWDGSFMKSNPPQVNLDLYHNANNDLCKAIKYETLRYDIYPLIENYINSYGDNSNLTINLGDEIINFNIADYGVWSFRWFWSNSFFFF